MFSSLATTVLPALPVATQECAVGEDLYSWSGPNGLGLMLFGGQVSGKLSAPFDPEFDAMISGFVYSSNWLIAPGASGSVAVNADGAAIGILVGTWNVTTKLAGGYFAPLPR